MTRLALGILTVLVGSVIACGSGGTSTTDDDPTMATVMCEQFVKKRLKAPSTAKFSEETAKKAGNSYVVTGAVDSQNSFGAMLRSNFTCTVKPEAGTDQWLLENLTGLN